MPGTTHSSHKSVAFAQQWQFTPLAAGGVVLAKHVALSAPAGWLTMLQGPNGVGKSTLLRRLLQHSPAQSAFLLQPEFCLSADLSVLAQAKVFIAHCPVQHGSVYQGLTTQQAALQALSVVGLADWEQERVGTLSSGQRARLGLLPLLVGGFSLWLLDEPFNAMDTAAIALLAQLIDAHLGAGGQVVMASHQGALPLLHYNPALPVRTLDFAEGTLRPAQGTDVVVHDFSGTAPPAAQKNRRSANKPGLCWRGSQPATRTLPGSKRCTPNPVGYAVSCHGAEFFWHGVARWAAWDCACSGVGVYLAGLGAWCQRLLCRRRPIWLDALFVPRQQGATRRLLGLQNAACPGGAGTGAGRGSGAGRAVFRFNAQQALALLLAVLAGLFALVPLLGLVGLMVSLTSGGAVLVYVLSLPLMVPVLVFGMEASQALDLGRSLANPVWVLLLLGALAFLCGPLAARGLVRLIQE
ncbi:MAG: ATP-binding cassette domain-containing protein [Limnobacter sp.]|nr:ATP-binding cassette domain-containing protein [Limnobacter sp.]